jgi:hypothetical protein
MAAANNAQTPLDGNEILKNIEQESRKKRAANTKRVKQDQKNLQVIGTRNFDGYIFNYAPSRRYPNGHNVIVPTKIAALQNLGLILATVNNSMYSTLTGKTKKYQEVVVKPMRYSFTTRKKPGSTGGSKSGSAYRREWRTVSIPKNARLSDILRFVGTWSKKPEAIEINGESLLMKIPKNAAYQGLKPRSAKAKSTKPSLT